MITETEQKVIQALKGDPNKAVIVASFLARKPIINFIQAVSVIAACVKYSEMILENFNKFDNQVCLR